MAKRYMNEEIRQGMVRVIGEQFGYIDMPINDAIELARETNRDVVQVNTVKGLPVVEFVDSSASAYEHEFYDSYGY